MKLSQTCLHASAKKIDDLCDTMCMMRKHRYIITTSNRYLIVFTYTNFHKGMYIKIMCAKGSTIQITIYTNYKLHCKTAAYREHKFIK